MNLLSDAYVNEHHHRQLNEARANTLFNHELPKQPSGLRSKATEGWQFIGSLRQIRIQVTFEVADAQPEPNLECC